MKKYSIEEASSIIEDMEAQYYHEIRLDPINFLMVDFSGIYISELDLTLKSGLLCINEDDGDITYDCSISVIFDGKSSEWLYYEQAEFKITKDRIFSRIKDYTVKEIVKDKSLYYILYDFESNKVRSLTLPSGLYSPHCFDSKDKIADMIAEIGIEKLKRYFFGVEV